MRSVEKCVEKFFGNGGGGDLAGWGKLITFVVGLPLWPAASIHPEKF